MKDFRRVSSKYKASTRSHRVVKKVQCSDSRDYIERELGKTIRYNNVTPKSKKFKSLVPIIFILWASAIAGLAFVYESVGREAGIIVALVVTLCWHLAKNRKLVKKEGGLYIPFSFYFLFSVVLIAVNLVAQFYRVSQFGLEHLMAHLNYFELLCQSSLIPVIAVMTLAELYRFLFVEKDDEQEEQEAADFIFLFGPSSDSHRGRTTE